MHFTCNPYFQHRHEVRRQECRNPYGGKRYPSVLVHGLLRRALRQSRLVAVACHELSTNTIRPAAVSTGNEFCIHQQCEHSHTFDKSHAPPPPPPPPEEKKSFWEPWRLNAVDYLELLAHSISLCARTLLRRLRVIFLPSLF